MNHECKLVASHFCSDCKDKYALYNPKCSSCKQNHLDCDNKSPLEIVKDVTLKQFMDK